MRTTNRQWICRLSFLLLGVGPLLVSLTWAAYRRAAYDAGAYRDWITGQTGLDIRIHDVVTAQPGTVRLLGVNLVDPETGAEIARCRQISLRQSPRAVGIYLPEISIESQQFQRFLELLHERVLRQRRLLEQPVHLVAEQVHLISPAGTPTLFEFRLDTERTTSGPEILLTFRWGDQPAGELVRLHLVREYGPSAAHTRIELFTGKTPLPCSLLTRFPDPLATLAKQATFQGDLMMASSRHGWTGELAGCLNDVPLDLIMANPTEPGIKGVARIALRQLQFREGRVTNFSGTLTAGPGHISPSWLRFAEERLGMSVATTMIPRHSEEMIAFDQLGVQLRIAADEFQLRGVVAGAVPEVVLSRQGQPLLSTDGQPLPPETVLRALLGIDDPQRPLYTADAPLVRMLLPTVE